MVAENTKKTPQESASVQPATKRATPKKPTTTTPVKQSKPAPSPTKKPSKRKLLQKVRKGKPAFQLVDEDDEAQQDDDPDPESEHSEQSSDDIPMKDEGNDSDIEDTDNAHIPKVSTTTWFKPIPESELPATPEPEWTIPPNDFPEPENNWENTYA
ncbi:hypothetical protein Tco_0147359, partial [Tanacetum coccineum]